MQVLSVLSFAALHFSHFCTEMLTVNMVRSISTSRWHVWYCDGNWNTKNPSPPFAVAAAESQNTSLSLGSSITSSSQRSLPLLGWSKLAKEIDVLNKVVVVLVVLVMVAVVLVVLLMVVVVLVVLLIVADVVLLIVVRLVVVRLVVVAVLMVPVAVLLVVVVVIVVMVMLVMVTVEVDSVAVVLLGPGTPSTIPDSAS